MNLLLDTHIFLWWLKDDKRLSQKGRLLIKDAHEIYFSSASIWEAGIKIQIGKLDVKIDQLLSAIESESFRSDANSTSNLRTATLFNG